MKKLLRLAVLYPACFGLFCFPLNWHPNIQWPLTKRMHFSIGVYRGESLEKLHPVPGVRNPVLAAEDVSDIPARFVADPFMVRKGKLWYLFFEAINKKRDRGEIGLAVSKDAIHWKYRRIVLTERFHLSYPYVFEWQGEYYMIPETFDAKTIRLYRAESFPYRWKFVCNLAYGPYADSSIVRFKDYWWLFTVNPRGNDRLFLFYSKSLTGPWYPHPLNPIVNRNKHLARPGGRIIQYKGRLVRFAQDDAKLYGNKVWAVQITDLSPEEYKERLLVKGPILDESGKGWNRTGMHHLDLHQVGEDSWLGMVDGRK